MRAEDIFPPDYIKQIIAYDCESGEMRRKDFARNQPIDRASYDKIKTKNRLSKTIMIDGVSVQRTKIAFVIQFGFWPESRIYHLNGNGYDFRFANLSIHKPSKKSKVSA